MKRYLPFVIVGLVALLTVGSGAMLYRAKRPASVASAKNSVPSVKKPESDRVHDRGERDAAVTLEEYGDFQCPPCGTLSPVIDEIEREYRPRLRIVFRHFPLPMHIHAAEAAFAAEAAGRQGRFWEMHDLLYREQSVWSKAGDVQTIFNSYAGILGLNADRFKADMQNAAVKDAVETDHREGASRGVKSTPTIFINNAEVPPTGLTKGALTAAIDSALKESSAPKKSK
jgi:protein-disulfide isomerase